MSRSGAVSESLATAGSVDAAGRTVTYASYGDPDGDAVVALHGMPGSRAFGAVLDEPARERGVRVLAPDRPGVGGTSPAAEWRVGDAAGFVAGFLDAVDVDAAGVLGFSAGGPHALACADALADRVTGTALLAAPAPPGADVERATAPRLMGVLARHLPVGLSLAARLQAAALARQDPAALVELFSSTVDAAEPVTEGVTVGDVLAVDADLALANGHAALAREYAALGTDWGVDPRTVGATVHVFHGTADGNVPPAAADFYERALPDPRLRREPVDHLALVRSVAGEALAAAAGRR